MGAVMGGKPGRRGVRWSPDVRFEVVSLSRSGGVLEYG